MGTGFVTKLGHLVFAGVRFEQGMVYQAGHVHILRPHPQVRRHPAGPGRYYSSHPVGAITHTRPATTVAAGGRCRWLLVQSQQYVAGNFLYQPF
jgi:hypothetical protein